MGDSSGRRRIVVSRRHPQDSPRINVYEPWDLQYWSDRWNVPRQQVVDAIRRVGDQVHDVAQALGKN
jgi:hypothetical protein